MSVSVFGARHNCRSLELRGMELSSPAFGDGEPIPEKYGYREEDVSPPLEISGVPDGADSLVLVMDDPDARDPAGKVWDHWVVWNIPADTTEISEGFKGGLQGRNDYGDLGYGGPNPPDRTHTYVFTLYAVDGELDLVEGSGKDEVLDAIRDHVMMEAELRGTYSP